MPVFIESVFSPLLFLFDEQKRIYWLYLLSSALLLLIFSRKISLSMRAQKLTFFNRSTGVDCVWLIINQLVLKGGIAPFFALQVAAALWINTHLVILLGSGNYVKLEATLLPIVFAFTLFIIDDFCKFLVHIGFHKIPLLWPFHAVHHSATALTPLTLYRLHPVEFIINSARSFVVGAFVSGLFVYLFANNISLFTIAGVNVFVFLFNLAGSNLRHSPFYLGFGIIETLFISPAQHQIHHSAERKHFDKNFGSALAIWDRLFNTFLLSKTEHVTHVGLHKNKTNRDTLKQQWWGVRGK